MENRARNKGFCLSIVIVTWKPAYERHRPRQRFRYTSLPDYHGRQQAVSPIYDETIVEVFKDATKLSVELTVTDKIWGILM